MKSEINQFRDEYSFLSNFYPSPLTYKGVRYPTVENAFQAQKVDNVPNRADLIHEFTKIPPSQAKRLGRKVPMRSDWDVIKLNIMNELVDLKFTQNKHLAHKLLETGDAILIEGNTWNDTYWGVCRGTGKNHLGQILMRVRNKLKEV